MKKIIFTLATLFICLSANADVQQVDKECKELGFKSGTPELAKCKLELLVLNKK